jgi:hypothetical protein
METVEWLIEQSQPGLYELIVETGTDNEKASAHWAAVSEGVIACKGWLVTNQRAASAGEVAGIIGHPRTDVALLFATLEDGGELHYCFRSVRMTEGAPPDSATKMREAWRLLCMCAKRITLEKFKEAHKMPNKTGETFAAALGVEEGAFMLWVDVLRAHGLAWFEQKGGE